MLYAIIANDNLVDNGLSEKTAIAKAKRLAQNPRNGQVFIQWYRSTDGQHGYLNPNGDHAITGKSWSVA